MFEPSSTDGRRVEGRRRVDVVDGDRDLFPGVEYGAPLSVTTTLRRNVPLSDVVQLNAPVEASIGRAAGTAQAQTESRSPSCRHKAEDERVRRHVRV